MWNTTWTLCVHNASWVNNLCKRSSEAHDYSHKVGYSACFEDMVINTPVNVLIGIIMVLYFVSNKGPKQQ
eukprot:gene12848-biopygen16436